MNATDGLVVLVLGVSTSKKSSKSNYRISGDILSDIRSSSFSGYLALVLSFGIGFTVFPSYADIDGVPVDAAGNPIPIPVFVDLVPGAVENADLQDDSISNSKLQDDAVGTAEIRQHNRR